MTVAPGLEKGQGNGLAYAAGRPGNHDDLIAEKYLHLFIHCRLRQIAIHVVGHDDPVVDGPQPAGHDDAHRADMKQAADLLEDRAGDVEALEFGAEGGAAGVQGVVVEGLRRGGLEPVDLCLRMSGR